ncbi:ankyrin repeat domain-containing protein 50 [Microdochium nivale]|nr:ankyrin repeat domain-containing protein 50 [Microdochium nivale]
MAPTTKRIAESEWEAHRARIERMYCQENRTQKEVQMFMSSTHGFSATKWQYETHFKAWNLKKNYSQEEWATMDSAIRRGEVDVSSAPSIYLGRPLSSKRVKKALSRYQCNPTTASTFSHLSSPAALPPGLTPPNAGSVNRGPPSQMPPTSPDANLVPTMLPPQNAVDSVQLWFPSPPRPSTVLQYPTSAGIDTWDTEAMTWPRAMLYSTELTPSLMFISWLSGHRGHYTGRQSIFYFLQNLSEEATSSFVTTLKIAPRLSNELGSLREEQRAPKIDARMFRRILPFSALELLEASTVNETYAGQISKADCAVFYLFIHALSNNMIDRLGFRSLGHMWRSLKGHLGRHVEYHFARVVRTRYSKTLCWKILQGAIEVNDAIAVRQIIRQWEIKVDNVCCFGRNQQAFTAVEVASGFLAAEVLQALLDEDADVNKTGPYTRIGHSMPSGGAFFWTLESERLQRMFVDGDSDLLPASVEMRRKIVSQLAMAGIEPPSTAIGLFDLHEHEPDKKTSELWELASYMIDTSLDLVVEELIFQDIKSIGEGRSFGSRAEAQDERERIVHLLQFCVPQDTNDWATIKEKVGTLLRRVQPQRHVIGHDLLSFQYQEESGFRVFISKKTCLCDNTARECAYFPLEMLPPPSVPPYKQLADRLRELTHPGHTQELMIEVETALGEDSRVFWEAVFSLGGFNSRLEQFSMLSAALEDQNEALIRKLVELEQNLLDISKAMLELRPTNEELYRLVAAAGVVTGTQYGLLRSGKYTSPHFFGTVLNLDSRPSTDELCDAIYKGDYAEIQHVLDITQLCPWESGALARALSREGASPSTAVLDTLRHYQPKPCPIRSVVRMGKALLAAARNGHVSVVQHIMQGHDLDVHIIVQMSPYDRSDYSLLGSLVQLADLRSQQCCQIVIRNGCRLGEVDRVAGLVGGVKMSVATPLLLAIRAGTFEIVKLLVNEYKADINLAPTRGIRRTPLQQAAESGHDDIARWLIDHGALINSPINQKRGATALQLASIGGYGGIMEMLINRGADLDAPGAVKKGRTALEGAAEHGRLDAVKLLLNSGTSTTGEGEKSLLSAIQYAQRRGHISVAELLEDHRDGRCAPFELEMDGDLLTDSAAIDLTDLSEHYFNFMPAYPSCS